MAAKYFLAATFEDQTVYYNELDGWVSVKEEATKYKSNSDKRFLRKLLEKYKDITHTRYIEID